MGQWVQEGNRILFETFLLVEASRRQLKIPAFDNDGDGLNYLAGKTLDFVNDKIQCFSRQVIEAIGGGERRQGG